MSRRYLRKITTVETEKVGLLSALAEIQTDSSDVGLFRSPPATPRPELTLEL